MNLPQPSSFVLAKPGQPLPGSQSEMTYGSARLRRGAARLLNEIKRVRPGCVYSQGFRVCP